MSQRFGRNQRRRAREAISELQTRTGNLERAHEMDRGLLRDQSSRIELLQDELDTAKELAGAMSILFPATEKMEVRSKSTDRVPLQVEQPEKLSDLSVYSAQSGITSFRRLPLETLIARIRPDALTQNLHVGVTFGDGVFSYGITRSAWHSMNSEQRQLFIRRELPRLLAQQIALHNFR